MKILMQQQHDFYSRTGGAETQFMAYYKGLKERGIEVEISLENSPDLSKWDAIHIFNVCEWYDAVAQAENAQRQGKPVFFSTVYWSTEEVFNARVALGQIPLQVAVDQYRNSRNAIRKLVNLSDVLLPNSISEYGMLCADAMPGLSKLHPYYVVRNGADINIIKGNADIFRNRFNISGEFNLCVGRIEMRKNIHGIVKAIKKVGLQTVFIGPEYTWGIDQKYAQDCKEMAKGYPVYFLGKMNFEELSDAYAAAKVLLQPSYFETPGLSAIEAGMCGCNLVVSNRGCTKEYFGDRVEYCNPADPDTIATAISNAWKKPRNLSLSAFLLSQYTWNNSIDDLINAYEKGLKNI
jgi:glycosyltransferase involved in cell wall biosynthesis